MDLDAIIRKVEASYPLVLQYDSRIQSLQAKIEGSSSWMPPAFSFGLNSFPYQLDMIKSKDDPMNWSGLMFSAEQMIPNSLKLKAKGNYYHSQKEVLKSNSDWTKNVLRAEVQRLYYQRLVAERKLRLLGQSRELLSLFITIAESRYKYNQTDLGTVFKAKAKIQELANMKAMSEAEISESNIGLNTLLGRNTNTDFSIDTTFILRNYQPPGGIQDTSSFERSDIRAMSKAIDAMELNKKWMATGTKPDFGLRVSHMTMLGMPDQFSIMGMITIPIAPWSSKMYKAEVKSMSYEIEAMSLERESMKRMAVRMVTEKLAMLKYEREQYENFEGTIIPSYQKNLDANLVAYRQNTGNFFQLLDAWEMLLMKRLEHLEKLKVVLRLQSEFEYETEAKR